MHYHNITKDDMLNGDGLRVVLWVAGCSHQCKGCHNPITWDASGGVAFDQEAKEEVFAHLKKGYISGLTFSGGDPLHPGNVGDVTELAKEVKERFLDKTIWLYTGDVWETVKDREVLQYIDVLVDGEFRMEEKNQALHWRGSANQRVIDVKKSLKKGEVCLHEENRKVSQSK